jgi:MoaA/NifB/PqqE/SkfB family radical SAM enzyme
VASLTEIRKTSVFLFLTEQCNLSCAHCYVSAGPTLSNQMSESTFAAAVELFIREAGVKDVRLTGGEPTLHKNFGVIAATLKSEGCRVRMISNGVRLDRAANKQELLKHVDDCWISLYGTSEARHRAVAGRGALTFDAAIDLIASIAGTGYPIGASVLLTPGDRVHVAKTLGGFLSAGLRRVRLLPIQPDGRASRYEWSWEDWAHEIAGISADLLTFPRRNEFEILTMNSPFEVSGRSDGCGNCLLDQRTMWSVAPNGNVYSCCFNVDDPKHLIGNVATLDDADLSAPFGRHCRGLSPKYWGQASSSGTRLRCPISALDLRN